MNTYSEPDDGRRLHPLVLRVGDSIVECVKDEPAHVEAS